MKTWKKWLAPTLFALSSVLFLVSAAVGPVIKGEPLNYAFLAIAFMFFTLAVLFFTISRKSGGGSGPPSA
jgi:hypothetical protein